MSGESVRDRDPVQDLWFYAIKVMTIGEDPWLSFCAAYAMGENDAL